MGRKKDGRADGVDGERHHSNGMGEGYGKKGTIRTALSAGTRHRKKHIVLDPWYGEVDPEYPDQWRNTILRELQKMIEAISQGPDYNSL